MIPVITRLVGEATAPIADAATQMAANVARSILLLAIAGFAGFGALIAGTIALFLFLEPRMGDLVAISLVACGWLIIALIAILAAYSGGRTSHAPAPALEAAPPAPDPQRSQMMNDAASEPPIDFSQQIDGIVQPVAELLGQFGLQKETATLLAAAQIARGLKPIHVAGLALIAGFVAGSQLNSAKKEPHD